MTKKKHDPLSAGHHMGLHYGYEVQPDGNIKLAPGLADEMRGIRDQEAGIFAMQEGVARFASEALARTGKARREWWTRVQDDLGLSIESGSEWGFDSRKGVVLLPNKAADEPIT